MSEPVRIVFMGTPGFAVPTLEALVHSPHSVVAVVTTPDREAGRGLRISQSAVKDYAIRHQLKVLQPENLRSEEFIAELKSLDADIFVVVAFRKLPSEVWKLPRLGTFNLHASLLPDYRGAAPIQRAVMNGETRSGLTTFLIDEKIDTGRIILRKEMDISPDDNAGTLHDRMMLEGRELVLQSIGILSQGNIEPLDQADLTPVGRALQTAPKINKEDCILKPEMPALDVHNRIRGLSPYPGAFLQLKTADGTMRTLKVFCSALLPRADGSHEPGILSDGYRYLHIICPDGRVDCLEVQSEGKRRMSITEFLRGNAWIQSAKACSAC